MEKPAHFVEIFLQPGEVYFGERDTRIRTLLGSCVAVTMWHPGLLIGGMCHYLLPRHPVGKRGAPDGRYADEALGIMLSEIRKAGSRPKEYQVKLFGGGHMFSARQVVSEHHVGAKNVEMARILMKQHGFSVSAEHLGGVGHRNIFFNIWDGHVWVRHQPPLTNKKKA
jgi:chemotaxis protein CheD